ncbi:MAG: indole-3-glycerol phosphate synthase TrpC [Actinobacteria bacterium]|nr:indole-3-glycerol phosphate synthase TrpC [Actinomycetota bacterium]NDE66536.1 indole-3-glycerol phosphate synthase TrpC [Actinomycetota bacterium]
MTLTYLDAIIAHHRQRAAADQRTLSQARTAAESQRAAVDASSGAPGSGRGGKALRDFAAALQGDSLMVIAEIKRRSPSRGALNESLDPRQLAKRYAAGGAACLSVLTDGPHFGGSAADLQNARAATTLPVLRKDFTVSALDVVDAFAMGADAVLLIVAALSDDELATFNALALELGLAVLVEVHDESELRRALRIEPRLIGVNQRDLRTFEVDRERAVRVAGEIPEGVVGVAESGITGMADAARLAAAGYRAVLVGEHLVTSREVEASLADLRLALPS